MKSPKVTLEKIFFLSKISKGRIGERKGKKFSEGEWKSTHLEPLSSGKRWGVKLLF